MGEIAKEDKVIKALLGLLIFSAFCSGLNLETKFFTLNISQLLVIVLFGLLVILSWVNRKRVFVLSGDLTSRFIYLYFGSNLFSSILFSQTRMQSLKGCVVIFTYIMIYITTRWAINLINDKQIVVWKMLRYNIWSAVFGILCMIISFITGLENVGTSFGQLAQSGIYALQSNIPSIRSLSIEPNLFSSATATLFCMTLSIYFLWRNSLKQFLIVVVLSMAILFSYTRSVYISLGVALIAIFILSGKIRLLLKLVNYGLMLTLIIGVIFIFLPDDNDIKTVLISRASSLFEFKKGSGLGRVYGYQIGIEGFKHNPIFGQGTLAAKTSFFNAHLNLKQELLGSAGWLNGAWIQSLHDTGLVGFIILLGIFSSIILANFRLFRIIDEKYIEKSILLGFLCGNIILMITSQLSSTLWISFPYIYWAINLAYIEWCKNRIFENGKVRLNGAE